MKAYADSLRYMQDQTVRYINKGYTMHELSDLIRLPEELKNHDYLRPLRGSEYQNVANIYAGNVGWYNGDPTEFARPEHKDLAQLYVDMMGGTEAIKKAAKKFIAEGKNGEAMQILTHSIRINHDDMESRELKAQAMEKWAVQQSTPGWRHWGLTGAMELRKKVPNLSGGGFFGDADKFAEAPAEDILDLIPTRLKAEELKANEAFKIQVDVEGEEFLLAIGNRVLAVDSMSNDRADLEVKVTRKQLIEMFIVQTKSASEAGVTVVRGDATKLDRLINLTDTFSQFQLIVR
jgi:alkyl sulfatase BDS1-like metallo-beta-lactamase superfamily hydrolase